MNARVFISGVVVLVTMRPEREEWVRACVERQGHRVPVIVVRNGRALATAYDWADYVLDGPQVKVTCLHLGSELATTLGAEWVSYWDDDDYYGPRYLLRVAAALAAGASWCGQLDRWMRTSTGRLWRLSGTEARVPLGGGISARLPLAVPWSAIQDHLGEDARWGQLQGPLTVLEPGDWAQCRWAEQGHAWAASDEHVAHMSRGLVEDCGPWDPAVVDGLRPAPAAVRVEIDGERHELFDPEEVVRRRKLGGSPTLPSCEPRIRGPRSGGGDEPRKEKMMETDQIEITCETVYGEGFGLTSFVGWAINAHPAFNQDGPGIRASVRMEAALKAAEEVSQTMVRLELRDAVRLYKAVKEPHAEVRYPLMPARRVLVFVDAIAAALGKESEES